MGIVNPPKDMDLEAASRGLEDGWSVPTDWYWRCDIFDFEMAAIFQRKWQFFRPRAMAAEPGDCVIGETAGTPIVVTRSTDAKLRGFINVCRHRGFTPVTNDCNRSGIVCPYHGWSYNLDGTLGGARGEEDEPGFDKDALSLIPISVAEWGPGIFINLDREAAPFLTTHVRLDKTASEAGFDFTPQRYAFYETRTFRINANWKLWYDNHSECYHCPLIHSSTFGEAFDSTLENSEERELETFTMTRFWPTEARRTNALRAQNYRAFMIFPGAAIIQHDDVMVLTKTVPTGPETTEYHLWTYREIGADDERVRRWHDLWVDVFEEDVAAVAVQQRALKSGHVKHSRYMTTQEPRMIFFNRLILDGCRDYLAQAHRAYTYN